jgi:ADP-dependent NAD(P)H-hydrate dehydratase / NAD(P)H-hydrate epimerase
MSDLVQPHPLYAVEQLRSAERAAQSLLPAGALMALAGRAAASFVADELGDRSRPICVVCGPGNNGGDGFIAAAELKSRGHDVVCVLPGGSAPIAEDARAAHAAWAGGGGTVLTALPAGTFDVAVDALFGIGLARPLANDFLAAADWLSGRTTFAIDLPSGLDADSGSWVGGVEGVLARATVTFIGDKPGLHTGAGVDAAGEVRVESLGIDPGPSSGSLIVADDLRAVARPRRLDTHKGTYGSAAIIGGAPGMLGAALLAARAALRLGAGRVYVNPVGAPEFRVDPMQPELMFRGATELHDLPALQAIVIGCGLGTGPEAGTSLQWAVGQPAALVIDADALNLLATDGQLALLLRGRPGATVVTPHPLEAARLLGMDAAAVQQDRIEAARALARRFNAVALLKGAGTVIARPDGRYAINTTGSPALATAGSGDVLAGMIGALLAQGATAWDAALAAAWLHGRAGEGRDIGLVAGDVAAYAADELRRLRAAARR